MKEEVTSKEIEEVVHNVKKNKSPGSDGMLVEFYIGLYDVLGKGLVWVVEDSRKSGNILTTFNSTFNELVPKKLFEQF